MNTQLDRDPWLHEQVAYLALGLLCSAVPGARIQLSTRYQDRRGVDLLLYHPDGKRLQIDLTEGHHQTRARKFLQNVKAQKMGRPQRWILVVDREPVVSIGADPCFRQVWDRLATHEKVSFSPEKICPKHGEKCPLVRELVEFGISLVVGLPPSYRGIFGVISDLRARFK